MGFRESDDFSDILLAGHQHYDAIQSGGDSGVRRRAVLQGLDEVAVSAFDFLGTDVQEFQHFLLNIPAMDSYAAAANLYAVDDEIVVLRLGAPGIGLQKRNAVVGGRGEEMVEGLVTDFVFVPLE